MSTIRENRRRSALKEIPLKRETCIRRQGPYRGALRSEIGPDRPLPRRRSAISHRLPMAMGASRGRSRLTVVEVTAMLAMLATIAALLLPWFTDTRVPLPVLRSAAVAGISGETVRLPHAGQPPHPFPPVRDDRRLKLLRPATE